MYIKSLKLNKQILFKILNIYLCMCRKYHPSLSYFRYCYFNIYIKIYVYTLTYL